MRRLMVTVALAMLCAVALERVWALEQTAGHMKRQAEKPVLEENAEDILTMEEVRSIRFSDIPADTPEAGAVGYLVCRGVFQVESGGSFDPYAPINRGEAATILWRMSGEEPSEERDRFADITEDGPWALAAAESTGMIQSAGEERFKPEQPVTRGQLAMMLSRYAEHMGIFLESAALDGYQDGAAVSAGEKEAMEQVLGQELYKTVVGNAILPDMMVSRLQMAQVLVGLAALEDPLAAEIFEEQPKQLTGGRAPEHHQEIQAVIEAAAQKYGAIGVQVAVVESGRVTDSYQYGWAVRNTEAMTDAHKIRVASISKVVVGMAAMLLQEEGIVSLDESIGSYWGFPIKNPSHPDNPITIRKIMTHTSSIFNAGDNEPQSYGSVSARLKGSGFSGSAPGSMAGWNYNNYAFSVLGMTLELASGRHLDDILREKLFSVMEVDGAYAAGDLQDTGPIAALYYHGGSVARSAAAQRGNRMNGKPGATGIFFPGGLTISAKDMGKLVGLLAADGRYEGVQLLSAHSVSLMEQQESQAVPGGSYQALPLRYQYDIYGRKGLYYHTGSAYGAYNCVSYDPISGDGVVVLTVGASAAKDRYGIYAVCGSISQYIYDTLGQA